MIDDTHQTAAAELALGLLEGDERATALRRVLAEPAFAAEVDWWRDRFAPLALAVPEVAPDEGVLVRVERSIVGPTAVTPIRRSWAWPAIATFSSMAAAALLVVVLRPVAPTPRNTPGAPYAAPPLLAAAVVPTKNGNALSAIVDARSNSILLTAAALADARHAAELWVIGGDGVPHSLGLLRGGAVTRLAVAGPDRARLAAGAVLAVSIEPLGGSPTGLPTGPVVAKGTLAPT